MQNGFISQMNDAVLSFAKQLNSTQLKAIPCGLLRCVNDAGDVQNKTIGDFIEAVKVDSEAKRQIRTKAEQNIDYDTDKQRLNTWVLSGHGGKSSETITPNGFISLDVDHISLGYEQQFKDTLCKLPFVAVCCLSVSGHGVFGLIYAPNYAGKPEAIQTGIYDVIQVFLAAKFPHANFDIDEHCKDLARKRFETYDPAVWVSNDIKPYEPIETLINNAWRDSRTRALASMLGYSNVTPSHAAVGAILALAAADGKLSIWHRSIFDENKTLQNVPTYPARIGAVILGKSGAGKGNLLEKIRSIAHAMHLSLRNYKTTAAMAQGVSELCNDLEQDEQNPKIYRWKPRQIKDVVPQLEINDEYYAAREVAKQAVYAMDKLAERRKLLDTTYEPQGTKKDSLPSYGFTPCYQYLCVSQFESFAEAIRGERTDTGDGRRELIMQIPDDESCPCEHFADRVFYSDMNRMPADIDGIIHELETVYRKHMNMFDGTFDEMGLGTIKTDEIAKISRGKDFQAFSWHNQDNCLFTFMRVLKSISTTEAEAMDSKTHLANIAAIECYLSGRSEMIPRDILTAAAITKESFALRRKLIERCNELELLEAGDKVTKWLERYWIKPGRVSTCADYKRAKINNGIDYNSPKVVQWDLCNLIEFYDNGNKKIRRGTPEELAEQAKEIEVQTEVLKQTGFKLNALTTAWNASHSKDEQYSHTWQRPKFSDDTPDAQQIRVCEMINRCLSGGKCGQFVKGERQSTLYRLRNVMMNNGMWNATTKNVLADLGRESGLPEKEIAHALREGR